MGNKKVSLGSFFSLLNKYKKKIFFLIFSSVGLTIVAIAISGLQIFYPYHFIIGFSIYILSFVPFFRKIYLSRDRLRKSKLYKLASSFVKSKKRSLIVSLIVLIAVVSFFALRPMDFNPFKGLDKIEITKLVEDDLYQSVVAIDYLESTGNELLKSLLTNDENTNVTQDIESHFDEFLKAVVFSESLADLHKYFDRIPLGMRDERAKSFIISYSLYLKKYEILHRIIDEVTGSEYKKKILNQYVGLFDRGKIYDEMVVRFYHPKTMLRINAGQFYMALYKILNEGEGDSYSLLYDKAVGSYSYLFSNLDVTLTHSIPAGADKIKNEMFDMWFPIQEESAKVMGHIILSGRGKEPLITSEQVKTMQQEMEPGDIMLQRRNWHLSNLGIPGFWTHSALYTGELDEMEEYFTSEFPFGGYDTFISYVQAVYPNVYEKYNSRYDDGYEYSVIEAIEQGVILQSLNTSAKADFIIVLRPKLGKKDKLLALFKAFKNYGKLYDYNFDFDTRDTLVCSELVYDAYYEDLPNKEGLHFDTTLVNGRKMVSPLNMAQKFGNEYGGQGSELSFVYFIRGNEDTRTASVSNVGEFLESINWSKFSFFQ